MNFNRMIVAALAAGSMMMPVVAQAQPDVEPYSMAAMGCMKLGECTEGVYELTSVDVLKEMFPNSSYTMVDDEANALLAKLNEAGVKVYVAEGFNFPRSHRGSYYTDTNTFYLNANHMWDQYTFIKVLRHEAWHVAQDCMAGGLDNTMIAVIHLEDEVPEQYQQSARLRYQGDWARAVPWEQEAIWAGYEPFMSLAAVDACASEKPMWETYSPTPKTAQWLRENGHLE